MLTRANDVENDDSVLGRFLCFLATDIAKHPEHLQSVDTGLVERLQTLADAIEVDFGAVLSATDDPAGSAAGVP